MRERTRAAVVYATLFGATELVAELVARELSAAIGAEVPSYDLGHLDIERLQELDLVVLGSCTWNVGQLPPDLEARLPELAALDLRGAALALFGTGDQVSYPHTFVDALGIVAEPLEATGARLVGLCPADGYGFTGSLGLRGDELLGLALDEDNEPHLTPGRVRAWVSRVAAEAGLVPSVSIGAHDDSVAGDRAGAAEGASGGRGARAAGQAPRPVAADHLG